MNDEKIQAIEEALAHQDQELATLNEIVTAQANTIDRLKRKISALEDKISNGAEGEADGSPSLSAAEHAARNKPPHY